MNAMYEASNVILLAADAVLYFAVLVALFRLRAQLGIGAFFCALGVMHFLETYLASSFYVALPFGIVTSPGSTVLFTGKLMLLLLVYVREDAMVVRQPIYGLLIATRCWSHSHSCCGTTPRWRLRPAASPISDSSTRWAC